jgi:hypothetical protein
MKENPPPAKDRTAGMEAADRLWREKFPVPFRNSYLGGKTIFCDFVHENLGCSFLEAKEWGGCPGKTWQNKVPTRSRGERAGILGNLLTSLEAFFFSFPHDETFLIKKDYRLKKLDGFGGKGFLQPQLNSATRRDYNQKASSPGPTSSGMLLEKESCNPANGGKQ